MSAIAVAFRTSLVSKILLDPKQTRRFLSLPAVQGRWGTLLDTDLPAEVACWARDHHIPTRTGRAATDWLPEIRTMRVQVVVIAVGNDKGVIGACGEEELKFETAETAMDWLERQDTLRGTQVGDKKKLMEALDLERLRVPPCIRFYLATFQPESETPSLELLLDSFMQAFNHSVLFNNPLRNPHVCRKGLTKSRCFCPTARFSTTREALLKDRALLVGVDGGGNKCRISVELTSGELVGACCVKKPSHISFGDKTWENIMEGVRYILSVYEIPIQSRGFAFHGCFGLAGCSVPEYVKRFRQNGYMSLFTSLYLTGDNEIAQVASHNLGDGGIIIIGTGSASYAKFKGEVYKSGGRGFPLSDVGSGAYIGLKAAKVLVRCLDCELDNTPFTLELAQVFNNKVTDLVEWAKKASPTDFSKLAPYVAKYARKDDPLAKAVVRKAAGKIAQLYSATVAKMGNKAEAEKVPFSLLGGLADTMTPYLPEGMRKVVVPPRYCPAKGAALLAGQKLREERRRLNNE